MPIYSDKKTGRLFIQFDFQNQTIKRRLPEHTKKKDAEKLEIKLKNDLLFESFGIEKQKEINYEDFLAQYFLPFAKNHYSPDGLKNVVVILKSSLPFFKGCQIRKIQAADIEKFKTYRQNLKTKHDKTRQASTVHRELNIISKIFNMAVKNDFIDYNPCSRVELPRVSNVQDTILPFDKVDLFLDNIRSDLARDVAVLILNTGLRQNDALNLKKFQVDFDNKVIRLTQGKSKWKVKIPMNEDVVEVLSKHLGNGSEYFFFNKKTKRQLTTVKKTLIAASNRCGLGNISTKILRRTFATKLAENNFSPSAIAKL
jgi:integrase